MIQSSSSIQQEIRELLINNLHGNPQLQSNPISQIDTQNGQPLTSCQIQGVYNSIPANLQTSNLQMDLTERFGPTTYNAEVCRQNRQLSLGHDIEGLNGRANRSRPWSFDYWQYNSSTWFGKLECAAKMKYRPSLVCRRVEGTHDDDIEKQLHKLSFRYKPADWMVKCGFGNIWDVDMFKLCTAGWQRGLQTFTVCCLGCTALCHPF